MTTPTSTKEAIEQQDSRGRVWMRRKSGETTVITYSKFRKMDEAVSRAEIVRVIAPYSKMK